MPVRIPRNTRADSSRRSGYGIRSNSDARPQLTVNGHAVSVTSLSIGTGVITSERGDDGNYIVTWTAGVRYHAQAHTEE